MIKNINSLIRDMIGDVNPYDIQEMHQRLNFDFPHKDLLTFFSFNPEQCSLFEDYEQNRNYKQCKPEDCIISERRNKTLEEILEDGSASESCIP